MYSKLNIQNIYVLGNNVVSEQSIIELAGLKDYPKLSKVSKNKIEEKLLANPFIAKADVKKSLFGKIEITIQEYEVLFRDEINDTIVLENGQRFYYDEDILGLPILTNQVIEELNDKFLTKMQLIDKNILRKISEITYDPNDLDKERFLLYMVDQNYVYITLNKIENINSYNDIVPTLEGKHGILYLDSGNHFEIKK